MLKKRTNAKAKPVGGVNKDPSLRVKVKMQPREEEDEDDEDEEPVRKKKKPLALEAPKKVKSEIQAFMDDEELPSGKRISKNKKAKLRSIFGDRSEKIQQLLEINDTDTAVALIYKRSLQSIVDLIPYAEHAVRKSKGARGVYQINSLISSMRELMVDIQSAQDRGMLGHQLVEQVLKSSYRELAEEILKEYSTLGADARLGMTDKEYDRFRTALTDSRERLAAKMTANFRTVKEQTIQYLQR